MIRNLIKVWHETLFYLNKKDVIEVMSDLEVKLLSLLQWEILIW